MGHSFGRLNGYWTVHAKRHTLLRAPAKQTVLTTMGSYSMPHATPIVFVVDDDVSVRESLKLLIDSAGWQPRLFAFAQEFLAFARTVAPSCLVLDVTLPDLNGLELQKRVARDRANMPIIFISGYGDVPITVQAMKAGAVEFLTKPLGGDELLQAIEQAIERSSA